jgi:prepilin peptidase CpaA
LIPLVIGGGTSVVTDLRSRRIPNAVTAGIAASGLALSVWHASPLMFASSVVGGLLGMALMLPGHFLGGTGAGDVKLLGAFGTLLGPVGIVIAFFYSVIAGGVLALLVAGARGRVGATLIRVARCLSTRGANLPEIESPASDNRFAFAPAIVCGVLAAALGV